MPLRLREPYEIASEYLDFVAFLQEDIEVLKSAREQIKKECAILEREMYRLWYPLYEEERREYERLESQYRRLREFWYRISYSFIRRERDILQLYNSTSLPLAFSVNRIWEKMEDLFLEIYKAAKDLNIKVKPILPVITKKGKKAYFKHVDEIKLSSLKYCRAWSLEIWCKILAASHTFSSPGKGKEPRHFEGMLKTYMPLLYCRVTPEGPVVFETLGGQWYDFRTYLYDVCTALIEDDEFAAFLIRNMGLSAQDIIGGIDVTAIYIFFKRVQSVPFIFNIYDHDYAEYRVDINVRLPRYYWLLSPEDLAYNINVLDNMSVEEFFEKFII